MFTAQDAVRIFVAKDVNNPSVLKSERPKKL
jgi:hypothetical protein